MISKLNIVAVAGTNGSGKDTVSQMLVERYGFFAVSATDMLADGLREKGWAIDREHKAKLSAEWRRQYGMAAVVNRGLELFELKKEEYKGFVVGSLRHPGEADRIHELGGVVIWIDADPKIRYQRITNTNRGVDKVVEDSKTFEEFMAEQDREMRHTGDSATLSISDVKVRADIFVINDSNDIEEFKNKVEKALQGYL